MGNVVKICVILFITFGLISSIMKKNPKIAVLFCFFTLLMVLFSCKKDETIDLSNLKDYYFVYSTDNNLGIDNLQMGDTVFYSFDGDSTACASYYEYELSENGIYELYQHWCDVRKYSVKGSKIILEAFNGEGFYVIIPLFDPYSDWSVLTFNDSLLQIKYLGSSRTLKCINKLQCIK